MLNFTDTSADDIEDMSEEEDMEEEEMEEGGDYESDSDSDYQIGIIFSYSHTLPINVELN